MLVTLDVYRLSNVFHTESLGILYLCIWGILDRSNLVTIKWRFLHFLRGVSDYSSMISLDIAIVARARE